MADIKNVIFRNSLNGYNKADVNSYLIKMNAEFTERENGSKENALNAEKLRKEAEEKTDGLLLQIEELKSEIEKEKNKIAVLEDEKNLSVGIDNNIENEYESRLAEKEAKLNEQESVITSQFGQIDALKEQLETAKEEITHLKADSESELSELKRKAQLYEKTSANIGDTILSANKTAEEIISAAKEEARLIREKADRELEDKRAAVEETAKRALEGIYGKLKAASEENRNELSVASSFAIKTMEKALSDISSRNEESKKRIEGCRDTVWSRIKTDIDSIGYIPKETDKSIVKNELPTEKEKKEKPRSAFNSDAYRKFRK